MNQVPLESGILLRVGDEIVITNSDQLEHFNAILGAKVEDSLKVFRPDGNLAQAKINYLSSEQARLSIESVQDARTAPLFEIVIGISRPPTMRKILEHATTMGCRRIILVRTELTEKSYLQSKILKEDQLKKVLLDGLSQSSCYARLPEVLTFDSLAKYLKWDAQQPAQRILLSKSGEGYLNNKLIRPKIRTRLFFGPERGTTKEEEMVLEQMGYTPCLISDSILRQENAVIATLAQVEFLTKVHLH